MKCVRSWSLSKNGKLKHYTKGSRYSPSKFTTRKLREIKKALGGCQAPKCGVTAPSSLDFAHIKKTPLSGVARGRGSAHRLYDIKRHPECYALLCDAGGENHHKAYDDWHDGRKEDLLPPFPWEPKSLLELAREKNYAYLLGPVKP